MEPDFEELVAARGHALLRFAAVLCGDRDLAEDLVQTALTKAYLRWKRVARADSPEAYLKAMIVNEHLRWWRRLSNRERPHFFAADPGGATVSDAETAHASRDAAWALLGRLPVRQRAVLVLRYYEDLADEQIAAVLGCGVSSVRSTASRALGALRLTVPTLAKELLP